MKFTRRLLAHFLLLIVAASVLFPATLPRALAQGVGEAVAMQESGHDHHAGAMAQLHASTDEACDGCADHDQAPAPCDDVQHQCCPGHLSGYPATSAVVALLAAPAATPVVDRRPDGFPSRVPEGLERPPRAVSA
ncbi:hypothetical protein SDC9_211895 [bioreactor metagenome]|uniref:DUF2946 domain-containing protein n=1 Tax=bioreactor metagenome TaxID=1076179 RepID=A0A645JWX1_9ZZZZ